jgi:hypothetical protein
LGQDSPAKSRCKKKADQFFGSLFRQFFWEEMATVKWSAMDITCPGPPQRKGTAYLRVPSIQWSATAPEHKNRTGNAPPVLAIFQIMLLVKSRCRSILLADCMNASGITQHLDIRLPHLWAEGICSRTPVMKRVVDNSIRSS